MTKTVAQHNAPLPTGNKEQTKFEQTMYQKGLFLSMALNMTWQLAIVVLVPIVGGYEIDQHVATSPLWTIVGFVIAVSGVAIVLRRVVLLATTKAAQSTHATEDKK